MCCLITILLLVGPRVGIFAWWLLRPTSFMLPFDTILWPILGTVFLPWTTVMYVLAMNLSFEFWVPIFSMTLIGLLADLSTYVGGAWGNRERFPRYVRR